MGRKTSIYLRDELEAQLKARSKELSSVINRDLERIYALYARSLRQIILTPDEACLIVDSQNGTLHDARSAPMLWAGIEDSIHLDGLAEKWDIDGPALVEKMKQWNDIQCLAVIDAVERFWEEPVHTDIREEVKGFFGIR